MLLNVAETTWSRHPWAAKPIQSTSGLPIYITEPFCFEESCNVIVSTELLQKVCKAEGLHFLGLKWDRASETHEDA